LKLVDARQHFADNADASRRQRAAGQVMRRMELVLFSITVVLELKSAHHPSARTSFGQLFFSSVACQAAVFRTIPNSVKIFNAKLKENGYSYPKEAPLNGIKRSGFAS
jgi:hypothetical protein